MLEDSSLEVINLMSYYNGLNKKKTITDLQNTRVMWYFEPSKFFIFPKAPFSYFRSPKGYIY